VNTGKKLTSDLKLETEQNKRYLYNIALWRVRAAIVAVEKEYVLHILGVCF